MACVAVVAALGVYAAPQGSGYKVARRMPVGGDGRWDYLRVDPDAHRIYVTRGSHLMVVDENTGKVIGDIPVANAMNMHGVALATDLGKGFTSNGDVNTVTVFDLKSLATTGTIAVGGHNPDAILYDPASGHLYTFNGRSQDISVIDPAKAAVIATIPAGGKPEFAASDGAGRIFFNIEDTAELSAIDSSASKRVATWPLKNCEEPTGLAIDRKHARLFSVCANGVLVVTDAASGRHVAEVPIGKGPDAAAFDAATGLVFSSNGQDGTLTVIHEDDPDHYSVVATTVTQKSARTMALDPGSHEIFLVAAEFGAPPPPSPENAHPRAPVLDGSFRVLVVGSGAPGR